MGAGALKINRKLGLEPPAEHICLRSHPALQVPTYLGLQQDGQLHGLIAPNRQMTAFRCRQQTM
ncbi:hypothetical protein CEE61_09030 [Stenotrophomonas maltophilia]|nr:hypothetical protein CEE61_09030 [Stenotrophomonas maltophilia]